MISGSNNVSYNPVVKVPLYISHVDDISAGSNEVVDDVRSEVASAQADQMQTLFISLHRLDQCQANNHHQVIQKISDICHNTSTWFKIVDVNMSRYSMQPIRCIGAAMPVVNGRTAHTRDSITIDLTTNLSSHPRTLLLLWHEYVYGLQGNKPTKNFTSIEMGRVKHTYCRRKCFWDVMVKLVNTGFTELMEIDKIRQPYGISLAFTAVLNKLQKDKKNDGHPTLCL
jgi:hypothetical protein